MTPKGQAFLAALQALCIEHQIALYVGSDDWDEPHILLEDLSAGACPLRLSQVEDLTEMSTQEYGV